MVPSITKSLNTVLGPELGGLSMPRFLCPSNEDVCSVAFSVLLWRLSEISDRRMVSSLDAVVAIMDVAAVVVVIPTCALRDQMR